MRCECRKITEVYSLRVYEQAAVAILAQEDCAAGEGREDNVPSSWRLLEIQFFRRGRLQQYLLPLLRGARTALLLPLLRAER